MKNQLCKLVFGEWKENRHRTRACSNCEVCCTRKCQIPILGTQPLDKFRFRITAGRK